MDISFDNELLRRIAAERADGMAWAQIAAANSVGEPEFRRAVESQPVWEDLLGEARRAVLAEAATEAVQVLRQALHSEEERIRMQAATQLLRLHLATLRLAAKAELPCEAEYPPEMRNEGLSETVNHLERPDEKPAAPSQTPASAKAGQALQPDRDDMRKQPGRRRGLASLNRHLLVSPLKGPQKSKVATGLPARRESFSDSADRPAGPSLRYPLAASGRAG